MEKGRKMGERQRWKLFWIGSLIPSLLLGGILALGSRGEGLNRDGVIVKLDDSGRKLWAKIVDSGGGELLRCGVDLGSDGYMLGGSRVDPAGVQRGWLIGVGKNGETLWNLQFEGLKSFYQMVPGKTGGYIAVAQNQKGDAVILKLDKLGRQIWRRKLGIYHNTEGRAILSLGGVGYLIVGTKLYIKRHHKGLIIKTDDQGHKLWGLEIGGNGNVSLNGAVELPTGEIAVVGEIHLPSGYWGGVVVKLAPDGTEKWIRFFHSGKKTRFTGVYTANNEIIAVGTSTGWGRGKGDGVALSYSFDGHPLWLKTFGTPNKEEVEFLLPTLIGSVAFGSTTSTKPRGWVVPLNSTAKPYWRYVTPFPCTFWGGVIELPSSSQR